MKQSVTFGLSYRSLVWICFLSVYNPHILDALQCGHCPPSLLLMSASRALYTWELCWLLNLHTLHVMKMDLPQTPSLCKRLKALKVKRS